MPKFQTFKDLNISFKPHPITGDLTTLKDEAAVKQAVINLLLTDKGERVFNSSIGSNIRRLLFETFDFSTAALIMNEIRSVLEAYEPRIRIESLEAIPNFEDNGFDVDLTFVYIGREDRPVSITFFLERSR